MKRTIKYMQLLFNCLAFSAIILFVVSLHLSADKPVTEAESKIETIELPLIPDVSIETIEEAKVTIQNKDYLSKPPGKLVKVIDRQSDFDNPKAIVLVNKFSDEELKCLSLNVYHEARNQSILGQEAVAWVTLNRVNHTGYPGNICDVVKQAKYSKWWKEKHGKDVPIRNKCHFSWWCDGKSDEPFEQRHWEIAKKVAYYVSSIYGHIDDPTQGAIMYHADYVKPYWRKDYQRLTVIDTHIFYGEHI